MVLALALAFTMAVPSLAGEMPEVNYMAIGDSIGAGCQNIEFMWRGFTDEDEPNFKDFTLNVNAPTGEKDTNIYATPFSYVSRVATKLNANKDKSVNATYAGLRSKDLCHILGIDPLEGDVYTDKDQDIWANQWMRWFTQSGPKGQRVYNWDKMFTESTKEKYIQGIEEADVITVELGQNELSAFFFNNQNAIISAFTSVAGPGEEAMALIKDLKKNFEALNNAKTSFEKIKATIGLAQDVSTFEELGGELKAVVDKILELTGRMDKESKYYFTALINFIKETNPNAQIIVTSVINPLQDADIEAGEAFLFASKADIEAAGIDLGSMVKLMNLVIAPFVMGLNSYINQNQTTKVTDENGKTTTQRNYYVATISDISMNPGEVDGVKFMLHPDDNGQQLISERILLQLEKPKAASGDKEAFVKVLRETVRQIVKSPALNTVVQKTVEIIKSPTTKSVINRTIEIIASSEVGQKIQKTIDIINNAMPTKVIEKTVSFLNNLFKRFAYR